MTGWELARQLAWDPVWPAWGLFLALVPLAAVVVAGWRRARRAGAGSGDWARRGALVAALALIGLGPSVPSATERVETNAEVFLVVDRTGSMAAEDHDGGRPRLDGVRADVGELLGLFPGARWSVLAFDSQATRQLPLTSDTRAVRTWAETLRQEITRYSSGSNVERPAPVLAETLEGAAERNPGHVRIVLLLADGENTDGEELTRAYAAAAPWVDAGAVLGYGTAEGGRMRSYDGTARSGAGSDAPWITEEGSDVPAVSRADVGALARVAGELGVPYLHREPPTSLEPFAAGVDVAELASDGRREIATYRNAGWPVALVVAALLAGEAFALAGRWRRLPRAQVVAA